MTHNTQNNLSEQSKTLASMCETTEREVKNSVKYLDLYLQLKIKLLYGREHLGD